MATAKQAVSSLPEQVDLSFYQGDDWYLDVLVNDAAGLPADLTGAVPEAQVRSTAASATILASFDITVDGNTLHLHLPALETAAISGSAVWDLQLSTPDVTTLMFGSITSKAEVTR